MTTPIEPAITALNYPVSWARTPPGMVGRLWQNDNTSDPPAAIPVLPGSDTVTTVASLAYVYNVFASPNQQFAIVPVNLAAFLISAQVAFAVTTDTEPCNPVMHISMTEPAPGTATVTGTVAAAYIPAGVTSAAVVLSGALTVPFPLSPAKPTGAYTVTVTVDTTGSSAVSQVPDGNLGAITTYAF